MNKKHMLKKLWLLPLAILTCKLLLASTFWHYLHQYISTELLTLLGTLWLAKLALIPLLGVLTMRLWKKSKSADGSLDAVEPIKQT